MKKLLTIENNWESFEYKIDEKRIDPHNIKRIELNDKHYDIIDCRSSTVSYSDMGHRYDAERILLYINVDGLRVNISENMYNNPSLEVYVIL